MESYPRMIYFAQRNTSMKRVILYSCLMSLGYALPLALCGQVSYQEKKEDVFSILQQTEGTRVHVYQSEPIESLFLKNVARKSASARIPGFRIRIYSNLGQSAREGSMEAERIFTEEFSGIPVYRVYEAPYFKVYAGDFRTKLEVHRFLKEVRAVFPDAFDIPSDINLPVLESN